MKRNRIVKALAVLAAAALIPVPAFRGLRAESEDGGTENLLVDRAAAESTAEDDKETRKINLKVDREDVREAAQDETWGETQEEAREETRTEDKAAWLTLTPTPTIAPPPGGIAIDMNQFPDIRFREYIVRFDTNKDGYFVKEELEKVTQLSCMKKDIHDMTGVQYFTKLKELFINENEISSLDVKHNPELTTLFCYGNKITALDVSHNPKLQVLSCYDNQIPSLDVTQNTKLQQLSASGNKIKSIDLSKNPDLTGLYLYDNPMKKVDISACKLMKLTFETGSKSESNGRTTYHYKDEAANKLYIMVLNSNMKVISDGSSDPTPTPTTSPDDPSFGDFIERLYKIAMNRESDPEGKAFWIKEVSENGKTGADCARYFLLTAPEFMARNQKDDEFVETLYQTFFDRASDEAGMKFWLESMKKGTSRKDVVNGFIESTEWCEICAYYGVKSGAQYHKSRIASKKATAFATRLYTCCLGRAPEEDGLKFWSLALTNLEKSGFDAANLFFTSNEFINYRFSDAEFLRRVYLTFMGRDPEPNGFQFWMTNLANGESRDKVLVLFAQSDEFTGICKEYGIERGNV